MTTAPYRSASARASDDLPAAVGPQMTRTLSSAKSAIELVPRELHDRGASVHVVRRETRRRERQEQRAHLARREDVAGLDGRLARDGRGEALVPGRGARHAVAGERIECLAKAAQGIEAWMRHRHAGDDQRVSTEHLDLEAEQLERLAVALERVALRRPQMQRRGKEQPLRGMATALERRRGLRG